MKTKQKQRDSLLNGRTYHQTSGEGLISKIYTALTLLETEETHNPVKTRTEDPDRHFSQENAPRAVAGEDVSKGNPWRCGWERRLGQPLWKTA